MYKLLHDTRLRLAAVALAALFAASCTQASVAAPIATASPSATASASPTPSPSPTPMPSPTPSPTAPPAATYFIEGAYEFVKLPPKLEEERLAQLRENEECASDGATDIRAVTKDGEAVGIMVIVCSVDPSVAALPATFRSFLGPIPPEYSGNVQQLQIGGRTVVLLEHRDQTNWIAAWQQRTFLVIEVGFTREDVEEIAAALITANNGRTV